MHNNSLILFDRFSLENGNMNVFATAGAGKDLDSKQDADWLGVIAGDEADRLVATFRQAMDGGFHTNKTILSNFKPPFAVDWSKYNKAKWNEKDDTQLPLADLHRRSLLLPSRSPRSGRAGRATQ